MPVCHCMFFSRVKLRAAFCNIEGSIIMVDLEKNQNSENPVQMSNNSVQQNPAGMQPNYGGNVQQPLLLSPEGSSLKTWMIVGLVLAVLNSFANFIPAVGLFTGIAEIACVLIGMSKANNYFNMHREFGNRSFSALMVNYILSQVLIFVYILVVIVGAVTAGAAANGQVSDQAAVGFLGVASIGLVAVLLYALAVRIWALVVWIKTISLVR